MSARVRRVVIGVILLLALVGAAVGIGLTLAAGTVCVTYETDRSFCGLNFLVWNFSSGVAIALSGALGALVGALLGLVASFRLLRPESA